MGWLGIGEYVGNRSPTLSNGNKKQSVYIPWSFFYPAVNGMAKT